MASDTRTRKNGRNKRKPLRYFYLNGLLHKKLHINVGADIITAWCYPTAKRVAYSYRDVKANMEPAFTTPQVGKMLNRGRLAIERAWVAGNIEYPQHTYGLDQNRNLHKYMWSPKDVLAAHAYFITVHRGRPRKDGLITPQKLPTERELRALMRNEELLYTINQDGEFVPVWAAPDMS